MPISRRRTAKNALTQWLSVFAAGLAVVAGFVMFAVDTYSKYFRSQPQLVTTLNQDRIGKQIAELTNELTAVNDKIKTIDQHINSLSSIPKEAALSIEVQNLKTSTEALGARAEKIESVILQSPSKALELPLLKRDIDTIKESQQSGLAALKDSVDRIYDLNKWLLGAMAVSIVTLAVGNFVKSRDNKLASSQD